MKRATKWGILLPALLVATAHGAFAAKLDKNECTAFEIERDALVGTGVQADMNRGAIWGKDNLTPERLKQVARLIEVTEQLTFRCGLIPAAIEAQTPPDPIPVATPAKTPDIPGAPKPVIPPDSPLAVPSIPATTPVVTTVPDVTDSPNPASPVPALPTPATPDNATPAVSAVTAAVPVTPPTATPDLSGAPKPVIPPDSPLALPSGPPPAVATAAPKVPDTAPPALPDVAPKTADPTTPTATPPTKPTAKTKRAKSKTQSEGTVLDDFLDAIAPQEPPKTKTKARKAPRKSKTATQE